MSLGGEKREITLHFALETYKTAWDAGLTFHLEGDEVRVRETLKGTLHELLEPLRAAKPWMPHLDRLTPRQLQVMVWVSEREKLGGSTLLNLCLDGLMSDTNFKEARARCDELVALGLLERFEGCFRSNAGLYLLTRRGPRSWTVQPPQTHSSQPAPLEQKQILNHHKVGAENTLFGGEM